MEDEVKYLIGNLSTACNKIEENKITEQKIFTLKNEYNKKITGEDERVDRIF
ncbi:hypothetical protein ACFHWD_19145 [Clostridium sp. MT-14]|uniref:Uncharacterized protein n=1 Tax=Clostridium aromativorans TaxID=2836848 RepID=A0ABS8N362_9CLOT|nr:hypothetical protein [Clostridium aromativorans]MCC9294251.1 hypothetical protein [Clostridium aromativorans]CAB1262566.1 hypothetical protein CLOSBL3_20496 [Clostridiaceae bacterium BL-3]